MVSESVHADSTRLLIPLDSLLMLPPGASYTARSGRAHASVSLMRTEDGVASQQPHTAPRGMMVYVETGCDSLERLCAYYEQEIDRLSTISSHLTTTLHTEEQEEKTAPRVWLELLSTFVAGLVSGVIITLLTTRKKWQKAS